MGQRVTHTYYPPTSAGFYYYMPDPPDYKWTWTIVEVYVDYSRGEEVERGVIEHPLYVSFLGDITARPLERVRGVWGPHLAPRPEGTAYNPYIEYLSAPKES